MGKTAPPPPQPASKAAPRASQEQPWAGEETATGNVTIRIGSHRLTLDNFLGPKVSPVRKPSPETAGKEDVVCVLAEADGVWQTLIAKPVVELWYLLQAPQGDGQLKKRLIRMLEQMGCLATPLLLEWLVELRHATPRRSAIQPGCSRSLPSLERSRRTFSPGSGFRCASSRMRHTQSTLPTFLATFRSKGKGPFPR